MVVEKKTSPLALSMRLPNTPGLSSIPSLHSHSNTVQRPTTAYTQQNKQFTTLGKKIKHHRTTEVTIWVIHNSDWEIRFLSHSWLYRYQNDSTGIHNNSKFWKINQQRFLSLENGGEMSQKHWGRNPITDHHPKWNSQPKESEERLSMRVKNTHTAKSPETKFTHSQIVNVRQLSQFFAWGKYTQPIPKLWILHIGESWRTKNGSPSLFVR